MKDKTDNHSAERLANIKQAAKEAGLPECVKLPSPTQLAQIAAGFGIHTPSAEAVKQAVSLFLRATAFRAKHHNTPVLNLASACGDHELASQLKTAAFFVPIDRAHLLELDEGQDEARRELAKAGLRLSKAKSVLENLRQFHRLVHMRRFLREKKILVTWKGRKPLQLWGTPAESESGEDQSKSNEARKSKCRMVTRKEYDRRTEAIAKQRGWRETDAERDWRQDLASVTEKRTDGRDVYRLPSFWLGDLIAWKKSLKRTGGVKSRRANKSSK